MRKNLKKLLALTVALGLGSGLLAGCDSEDRQTLKDAIDLFEEYSKDDKDNKKKDAESEVKGYISNEELLSYTYSGKAYITIDDNVPNFTKEEIEEAKESYEEYGELDEKGRCTIAVASVGKDIMPTEKRGSISKVKPTGWQSIKYDNVPGKNLYNRCHLIGYQLTGENANERNLITGTRFLNISGMLDTEDEVADYVKSTGNHVLYRVTPIFNEDELVARGVRMEGYSVEDDGEGVCFDYYAFNAQPGIEINYKDGTSRSR